MGIAVRRPRGYRDAETERSDRNRESREEEKGGRTRVHRRFFRETSEEEIIEEGPGRRG